MKIVTSWLTKGLNGTEKNLQEKNSTERPIFEGIVIFFVLILRLKVIKSMVNESTRYTVFQVSLSVKQQLFPGS